MPTIITRGAASARGFGFAGKFVLKPSQQAYTTPGTYSWVAPAGVTSVSVVAVGGGGGGPNGGAATAGGGGGLGYINNYTIVPGNSYQVVVGSGGLAAWNFLAPGGDSYFVSVCVVKGGGGKVAQAAHTLELAAVMEVQLV